MKKNYVRPAVTFEFIEEELLCGASNNIAGTNTQDYTNDPFGSTDDDIKIDNDPISGGYMDDEDDD